MDGENEQSQIIMENCGQQSTAGLGPWAKLFSIFVADVPREVDCHILMFADDKKVYILLNNPDSVNKLNNDFHRLQEWSNWMQMWFHSDKCKVMRLGVNTNHAHYILETPDDHIYAST